MKTAQQQTATAHHLQRNALLYVRQLTTIQVAEHSESIKRQYALHDRAVALRLLDACARTDTLIGSEDDLYDPKDLQS